MRVLACAEGADIETASGRRPEANDELDLRTRNRDERHVAVAIVQQQRRHSPLTANADPTYTEERFRRMFENAAVGMSVTDLEGTMIALNDRFCALLGYRREELLGRSFRELMMPDEIPAELERQRMVARGELDSFTRDKRYLRKDGSTVWGNITVSVIRRDQSGKPVHIMGILQDISERKQLEQALQQAKARLEFGLASSNLSVFEFDMPDGRLETTAPTLVNFWESLGYPVAPARDYLAAAEIVLPADERSRVHQATLAYLSGDSPMYELEHRLLHRDGSTRWSLARGGQRWRGARRAGLRSGDPHHARRGRRHARRPAVGVAARAE